jgi:tetratricopeptide (TPR) repeat protein
VARFFRSLAADGGLLLFLDDLHWADHGSLALLHYLMRDLREAPWLAVATYREVELGRDHPLAAALVEWNRERLATRVTLGRFGLPETSALLATLFGQETVSADFAAVIHRETEGNPFFIEEVVKALIEQGQIYREGGEWQRHKVDDLLIPQSIKSAVGRRLERLTPACLEVLHAAAALGKTFAFAELAQVAGPDENALLDALDEASAAQLMRADPGERFAFTHDKIREVLYEELNPIRRRRLHQKIGEALERLHAGELEEHAPDLAYHYTEGGNLEKGLDYSLRAARRARGVIATEEALGHLRRARDSAEALEDRERLIEIDQSIGDLYSIRGEYAPGVEAYERALAAGPPPALRAVLLGQIGELYTRWSDPRAMEILNAALEALDPATQAAARAQALAMIGRLHHYRGEHSRAIEHYEQARVLAEPVDEPVSLAYIYAYFAGAYQHMARFQESMQWAKRCIALGERHRNALVTSLGNEFMAEDLAITSHFDESMEYVRKNIEIARRIGSLDRMAWTAIPAAAVSQGRGDLEQALAESDRGIELMGRIGDNRGAVFLHRVRSEALTDFGRDEEAGREAEYAHALGEKVGQLVIVNQGRSALGYWKLRSGDIAGSMGIGREIETSIAGTDNRNSLLNCLPWYEEACLEAGAIQEAERVAAFALALAEECEDLMGAGCARRTAAGCAARRGDRARAEELFERAIADLDRVGARLEAARARARRAEARQAAGDRTGAEKDRAAAAKAFEACGAARDLARLRAARG